LLLAETDGFLSFGGNGCNIYYISFSFRRDLPVLGGQQIQNNGQNSQATADTFYSDLLKNKTLKGKNNGKILTEKNYFMVLFTVALNNVSKC
jgi:hypothetical protein